MTLPPEVPRPGWSVGPRRWFAALPDNVKRALCLLVAALGFTIMAALVKLLGNHLPVTQTLFLR